MDWDGEWSDGWDNEEQVPMEVFSVDNLPEPEARPRPQQASLPLSLSTGGLDTCGLEDFHSLDRPSTLEPTWWVMDREPGMDDLAEGITGILKKMQEDLKIYPFQDRDENDRLFLARFEFPKYGEDLTFPEAIFAPGKVAGWIDFLAGFPVDDCEMLLAVGEYSTKADKVTVMDGAGKVVAPVPEKFFQWPDQDKVLFNLTALPTKNLGKMLAPNLGGEPKPAKAHWWFRVNLVDQDGKKWPVPGEFLGLGVRMMPDKPWGHQKSSPFVWSGNFVDTVYYSGAVVKEIIEPTDDMPCSTYTVTWRGKDIENVRPSDFTLYKVGDRVTILKDVSTEKKTQLWKDDDMKTWGDGWQIVPITFYGLEQEA